MTVNICNYIPKQNGQNFYVLTEATGSWILYKYPAFQFKFGTAETRRYDYSQVPSDYSTNRAFYPRGMESVYSFNSYWVGYRKENVPLMKYDGDCRVTFKLVNRGHDTDSWSANYTLLEAGLLSDTTCLDPVIRKGIPWNATEKFQDGSAYEQKAVERRAKENADYNECSSNNVCDDGGKYDFFAPFMETLPACKALTECTTEGNWIKVSTDTDCGDGACRPDVLNACRFGTFRDRDDTATLNRWYCDALQI